MFFECQRKVGGVGIVQSIGSIADTFSVSQIL